MFLRFLVFSLGLVVCSAGAAANELGIRELQRLMQEKQVTSVPEFLDLLPESWRANVIPIRMSSSQQGGTRLLLRAPGSRVTMSINLDHTQRGFNTVEIKEVSASRVLFAELSFERDHKKMVPPPATPAPKGHLAHVDIVDTPVNGSKNACSACHPGGDARFDLRETLRNLNQKETAKTIPWFHRLADKEDERIARLKLPETLLKDIRANDEEKVRKHFEAEMRKMHEELAILNAQVVAKRIEALVAKEPPAALGMAALLKGCPLDGLFTTAEWERRIQHFSTGQSPGYDNERMEKLKALRWNDNAKDAPHAGAIEIIKARIEDLRTDYAAPGSQHGQKDEVDTGLLARLELYWNPVAASVQGRDRTLGISSAVAHWSMTSQLNSYWFGGTFAHYNDAIRAKLEPFIAREFNLPSERQTCQALVDLHRERYELRTPMMSMSTERDRRYPAMAPFSAHLAH